MSQKLQWLTFLVSFIFLGFTDLLLDWVPNRIISGCNTKWYFCLMAEKNISWIIKWLTRDYRWNIFATFQTRLQHVSNTLTTRLLSILGMIFFFFSASAIHCWYFLELPQLCLTDAVLFSKCTFYILAKPKIVKKRNGTVLLHELSSSITQLSFSLKLMKIWHVKMKGGVRRRPEYVSATSIIRPGYRGLGGKSKFVYLCYFI